MTKSIIISLQFVWILSDGEPTVLPIKTHGFNRVYINITVILYTEVQNLRLSPQVCHRPVASWADEADGE